jgi:peptide/nickel transport system permease protein
VRAARVVASAYVGLVLLAALGAGLLAAGSPDAGPGAHVGLVSPWDPNAVDKGHLPCEAPSARHLLGTDGARRDVLSRLVHGTRVVVAVGLGAVGLYALIGILLGAAAGFLGGITDVVVSRLAEVLLAVPTFFLLLAVMGVRDNPGVGTLVAVLGLASWMRIARLTRAEVLRVRRLEFVLAAEALGLSPARVLFAHVLPNSLAPALVSAAFGVASAVLTEASLSFLGFGAPPEVSSWGALVQGALQDPRAWWLVVAPGLALLGLLASANVLGEAAREALDPRSEPAP